jgi:hypothetical protein
MLTGKKKHKQVLKMGTKKTKTRNGKNLFHDFPNFFSSLANNGLTFNVPKDEVSFMTLMFNLNNNFEPIKFVSGHYYVLHVTCVSNVKQKSVCYWKENKPSNGAFDLLTT